MNLPIYMCIVVTTKCNLHCQHCNQQDVMAYYGDYEMGLDELSYFIDSCKRRRLHFYAIELTGGEPSLWTHLEEGLRSLKKARIAGHLSLITNGNDAQRVSDLATEYCNWYNVSVPQATPQQLDIHRSSGLKPLWNPDVHHPTPKSPLQDAIPANCMVAKTRQEIEVMHLLYLHFNVYYCCMAASLQKITKPDPSLVCKFAEDFSHYFRERKFDKEICSFCICNTKVWGQT